MARKIAFLFPGQGAQSVGMGQDLIENFSQADELIDEANRLLGFNLKSLCFDGPKEELDQTINTQPAIFAISIIADRILRSNGVEPVMTAGHSLGEYSALCSAGIFDFKEGVKLVRKRGEYMERALPAGRGGMAAIIKLDKEKIIDICDRVSGICEIANYNSPLQTVISGEKDAVHEAVELARDEGALKAIELDVSGPFHSSLMEPAREKLAAEIDKIDFNQPTVPIVANVSADFAEDIDEIRDNLLAQLTNSVRWEESMRHMVESDVDTFIEVGPGQILKGLMKRIDRSVDFHNVFDRESLDQTFDKLEVKAIN